MYLSYSGFKTFTECQRAFYYRYIKRVIPKDPGNSVHSLYGNTVGKIFELFYRDRMWCMGASVPLKLLDLVTPTLNNIILRGKEKGEVFNWSDPELKPGTRSIEEMEKEVRETIPRGVKSIVYHRLVGTKADAEVVLDGYINGHTIGGRADFIIQRVRPNEDLVIIDGKGSRWREKYTNDRQLRWYAMLYWVKYGVVPDRLGFLYWRCEPETSVDWKEVTQRDLENLRAIVFTTIKDIEGKKKAHDFLSSPGGDCKRCAYLSVCKEGARALSDGVKAQISKDQQCGVEDGEVSF